MLKKIISIGLATVMLLALCACGGSTQADAATDPAPEGLQVGFAREIVMPKGGSRPELDGTAPDRIMDSIVDNLTVTCVALRGANGETVLLYTMDRKSSGEEIILKCRPEISKATGIPEDHIMLAATHTHSAPNSADGMVLSSMCRTSRKQW